MEREGAPILFPHCLAWMGVSWIKQSHGNCWPWALLSDPPPRPHTTLRVLSNEQVEPSCGMQEREGLAWKRLKELNTSFVSKSTNHAVGKPSQELTSVGSTHTGSAGQATVNAIKEDTTVAIWDTYPCPSPSCLSLHMPRRGRAEVSQTDNLSPNPTFSKMRNREWK